MTTWGIVATIKAPQKDVLNFAAHHIELGAHRIYIYLDEAAPETFAALKAHPKIRVMTCDDTYWAKRRCKRPRIHQARQTANATHAYNRKIEIDWLAHIDVDEFIWPEGSISNVLKALPDDIQCARIRPIEALSGDGTAFKGFIPNGPARTDIVQQLYPTFGAYLKGGFLSHVAGKLFVRTGMADVTYKIHNVFQGDNMNPSQTELSQVELCHCHAKNWNDWISAFRYRLDKGSYRAGMAPVESGGLLTLHDLLKSLDAKGGNTALRQFFDEVSADTPDLRARLEKSGLLRLYQLDLSTKRARQFPSAEQFVS